MESTDQIKHSIVFLGDSAVGKSSIINQYSNNTVSIEHRVTIGIDFLTKIIDRGEKKVNLKIWDTAGQEKFRSLIPSYIHNSTVAVLVYDITNRESFEHVQGWYTTVLDNANPKIFVVGNKIDLEENREISEEEGRKYAESIDADFAEVSALNDININQLFERLADVPVNIETVQSEERQTIALKVDLKSPSDDPEAACGC